MLNMKNLSILSLGIFVALATPIMAQAAVQKPADQIFATQQNTGKNSDGNCSPATAKMVLNAYGLGTNISVQDISEKYGGLGHGGQVLEKFGLIEKFLNNDDTLAKQYLDKGCILTVGIFNGYGPHEGVALDYRTTNGYIEYYVLDPSKPGTEPYWARNSRDVNNTVGTVDTHCAWIYSKLEKFDVVQTSKSGTKFNMTLYYDNNSGMFLYSKEDNLKYMGTKTENYNKALNVYNKYKDGNTFNVQDVIYKVENSIAMINNGNGNDAYFTLDKAYVAKTWGIVR